jgi:hypothetical protein
MNRIKNWTRYEMDGTHLGEVISTLHETLSVGAKMQNTLDVCKYFVMLCEFRYRG